MTDNQLRRVLQKAFLALTEDDTETVRSNLLTAMNELERRRRNWLKEYTPPTTYNGTTEEWKGKKRRWTDEVFC